MDADYYHAEFKSPMAEQSDKYVYNALMNLSILTWLVQICTGYSNIIMD
jgi:hypothetical protein